MSVLSPASACLALSRPANCGIACASVLVGVFIAGGDIASRPAILAALSGWSLCAGANALNDWCDVEIDRRNKPGRPLASGAITRASAMGFAALMSLAGVGLGAMVGPYHLGLALFAGLGAALYNVRLKRRALIGNLTASGVASLAFFYGGLLGPHPLLALIPTGFAFFFHFGREIIKDIEDVAGDAFGRVSSIPLRYGVAAARVMATVTFMALILTTVLPYATGWYGAGYLALAGVVDLTVVYVLWSMWRDASPENAGRLSRILKADMIIGLIALCLGR